MCVCVCMLGGGGGYSLLTVRWQGRWRWWVGQNPAHSVTVWDDARLPLPDRNQSYLWVWREDWIGKRWGTKAYTESFHSHKASLLRFQTNSTFFYVNNDRHKPRLRILSRTSSLRFSNKNHVSVSSPFPFVLYLNMSPFFHRMQILEKYLINNLIDLSETPSISNRGLASRLPLLL